MKFYNMRVDEETHDRIAEMAKKDDRSITKELSRLVKFAYSYIDDQAVQAVIAMAPKKGMTVEEVKESSAYQQLEKELADLKQENWDLDDRDDLTMDELRRLSDENSRKQDEVRDKMRAMLNV